MRSVGIRIFCMVILVFFLCSCSSSEITSLKAENTQIKNQINSMKKESDGLRVQISKLNEELAKKKWKPNVTYCSYEFKKRLILKPLEVHLYPGVNSQVIDGEISSNTLVDVIECGILENENQDKWLYVVFPVYDTPMNNRGWILEKDTVELTEENRELIYSNVTVKKGTPIYETFSFSDISEIKPIKLVNDTSGRLEDENDGYAHLHCAGGWDFWVEKKYVQYPGIE